MRRFNSLRIRGILTAATVGTVRTQLCAEISNAGTPLCFGSSLKNSFTFYSTHFWPRLLPWSLLHRADGDSTKSSSSGLFRFFDIWYPCDCSHRWTDVCWYRGTPSTSRINHAYNSLREASVEMRVDLSPIHSDFLLQLSSCCVRKVTIWLAAAHLERHAADLPSDARRSVTYFSLQMRNIGRRSD